MYKVFIVDDEEYIIKSLIRSVKWEENGFEIVSTSNDGIDACEAIAQIEPHLVFTDIRMPGMSGLELIKNLKERFNNILFIVISGYAEFAYAQKALNYGALGFCLKPFEEEEINNLLKKAKTIIDEANVDKEYDLISLIEEFNEDSYTRIENIFKKSGIETDKGVLVFVSIGCKRITFANNIKYIGIKAGSSKFIYFVQGISGMEHKLLLSGKITEEIKGIGIADAIYSTKYLKKSIDDATMLAFQYFITGKRGVFLQEEIYIKEAANLIKRFEKAASKLDIDEIKIHIADIYINIQSGSLNIKNCIKIYNTYINFLSHAFEEDSFEDYIYRTEELCALFKDARAMMEHLEVIMLDSVGRRKRVFKEDIKNEYFKKLIQYIDENFYKEISIQSLSQEFVINPNYISQLFRKELGMTFTEYITKLRIDYAKELLRKNKFSVEETANKCGYTDYFYFIRVFKKITGSAPGQFRNLETNK